MKVFAGLMLMCALVASPAQAQEYPSQPVRLVVPFPAGGGGDFHGRLLALKLQDKLNQPVVVENRAGANGNIGADYVAKAAPDGYTVFLGGANVTMAPSIYANLSYDIKTDLLPVSLISRMQNVLLVPANSPFQSVADVIQAAKERPGELNYASSGAGGSPHLAMELMGALSNVQMTHVPYKGDSPIFIAMMRNDVDLYFASTPGVLEIVKSGKLRPLAVSATTRSPMFPDVPTMEEAGVPGFDLTSWWGLFLPANTPRHVVDRLNSAIRDITDDPDSRHHLA